MEFLTDTKIPFLRYRKFFVWFSIACSVGDRRRVLPPRRPQLRHRLRRRHPADGEVRREPSVDEIRAALGAAGQRDAQIQQYGRREPRGSDQDAGQGRQRGGLLGRVAQGPQPGLQRGHEGGNDKDLNQRGTNSIANILKVSRSRRPDGRRRRRGERPLRADRREGVRHSPGTRPVHRRGSSCRRSRVCRSEAYDALRDGAFLGSYVVRSNQNVGPQIGRSCAPRALWRWSVAARHAHLHLVPLRAALRHRCRGGRVPRLPDHPRPLRHASTTSSTCPPSPPSSPWSVIR